MKVRDIQKYIEGRCPTSSIAKLGTDKEPFLETIYGQDQELDSTIRDVASFAKDSEEQLFYEFVQNAFDANADSLCFYFDEHYLIVLNNGEPFYTDPRDENVRPRDGQLYNFLAKGKSIKAGDAKKSGEYGQGSKLLYTLISDKSAASNKTQLIKSIKEERKGPYIVSWRNIDQLNNFRYQSMDGWTYTDPHAEMTDLLVCKILMTYYPIAPGVDKSFFSLGEFRDIREAFERLVDPKRNINRLKRGTAIIIPLGIGQYEAISAEENLKKVMVRLGGFASLTSDKERNYGRHLEHIYVAGQEVEMHSVRSQFVEFSLDGDDFAYQFAFNPVFAKDNYVTLFKTLPVLGARYRMGFIIDSQNFELDSSRQRINDTGKTGIQLSEAFRLLLAQIQKTKAEDKELFDYIYDSLMASRPGKQDADSQFISEPFYKVFTPFIRENVKTSDGDYLPMQMVRSPLQDATNIPLQELGITDIHWVHEGVRKDPIRRFGIEIQELSLREILLSANKDKLAEWIKGLSKEEYLALHGDFLKLSKEDEVIAKKALFRTNHGNVLSFVEVLNPETRVFTFDDKIGHAHLDRCPEIEYVLGPVTFCSNDQTTNCGTINVSRIARHIEYLRESDARTDVAAHVLVDSKRFARTDSAIRGIVPLLKSLDGTYKPLNQLIRRKPDGTILFDSFCVTGYVPGIIPDELFISKPEEIWEWLTENMETVSALPDWREHHLDYLKDIVSAYKSAGEPSSRIELYLDDSGVPTLEKSFWLQMNDRLDNEQYERFQMFSETKGYSLTPYQFKKTLHEAPFVTESVYVNDILGEETTVDSVLLRCIVKLAGTSLLRGFKVISEGEDKYTVSRLHGQHNYTCAIESEAIDAALKAIGYNRIDPEVCRYFEGEMGDFELTTSNDIMVDIIGRLPEEHLPVLLPVIKRQNADINHLFFDSLPELAINTPLTEDSPTWQVIDYGLGKASDDDFYRDRLLELITHGGEHLPDTIKSNIVTFNGTEYDLYQLLGDIKTENELVDKFFECIPDPARFRSVVYADSEEAKSPDEVYNALYNTWLTVPQLRFCLDYSLKNKCTYENLEIASDESLSDALEMVGECGFAGFDQYFKIAGFDKEVQAYAPAELLLDSEKLPSELHQWIAKDREKALLLLRGLNTEASDYIAIRAALRGEEHFTSLSGVVEDEDKLRMTIKWIANQAFSIPFNYSSPRFLTLYELLERLPEGFDPLPGLRFTPTFKEQDGLSSQILSFETLDRDGVLMDFLNVRDNARQIEGKQKLKAFFGTHRVYGYTVNFLSKQSLNDLTRYTILTTAEKKPYQEWSTKVYNQWKETPESEGISIFISPDPVSIILTVVDDSSGEHALDISSRDDLYGYDDKDKTVVIQHPNPDQLTEMKTLEQVARAVDFFKNPFISLQSIYVDMVEQGIDPNALDEDEKKAVEIVQKLGGENVEKIQENLDTVKDIVEGLTEEELKIVSENKDKIRNLLEDLQDDDESMVSLVRKTIGYLGELIYEQYLKNSGIEYDYAAARGVGDYDFMLPATDSRPTLYVDVKTNLYSFKEEAVPLYIHKSQNDFMQRHPDEPFRIVRISLADLDLNKSYERIRDLYGAEADYEVNPELEKACRKIAKDYWRKAEIEEFDAASPEYAIKIERLPRP